MGSVMSLVIVWTLLIVLDIATWLWGHDSRDGREWDYPGRTVGSAPPPRTHEDARSHHRKVEEDDPMEGAVEGSRPLTHERE